MRSRPLVALGTVLATVVLAASVTSCGSTSPGVSVGPAEPLGDATTISAEVTTTSPGASTTSPTTTAAPTTVATIPTTTTTPPTTLVPEGWTPVDPDAIVAPLAYPCCASNWMVKPSPPLPAAGQPLADGVYAVSLRWPATPATTVEATINRFEHCALLPPGTCEDNGGFQPDDAGIDTTASHSLSLPLDDTLRVVLGGMGPVRDKETGWYDALFAEARGTTFAGLLTALDADYAAAIAPGLAAGEDEAKIIDDLRAHPVGGFEPIPMEEGGLAIWRSGDAPGILFQTLDYSRDGQAPRGSDVVGAISLIVDHGRMTLITYAGFYS